MAHGSENHFSILFALLAIVLVFGSPNLLIADQDPSKPTKVLQAEISNDDCLACHDTFNVARFKNSVHGKTSCHSCHSDIREVPHEEHLKKVDCALCHKQEVQIFLASDHGKKMMERSPVGGCVGCHGGAHEMMDIQSTDSQVNRLNIAKTCAGCHEDPKKMDASYLTIQFPFKTYAETVHGKAWAKGNSAAATCTDCHGSHDLNGPLNLKSKINHMQVPKTCGQCHGEILKIYSQSVHGQAALTGKREAPVCTDCHGEHTIKSHTDPNSSVFAGSISEKTCGQCHAAEKIISKFRLPSDRLKTYEESYHGLASKFAVATVANCASCHGAHNVLPSSDPRSTVYSKNLVQTCGRCHTNIGEKSAQGLVHISPSPFQARAVYYVSRIYRILIFLLIGGMLIHNFLDFRKKLLKHYQKKKKDGKILRFTISERIQHGILTFSFLILAYSGFALKYSQAWWARPFLILNLHYDLRAVVHRVAALVFSLLSVYHLLYLCFTSRGRKQLELLMPCKKDLGDWMALMRYNLGYSKQKPLFGHYNYIEKAEYWALMWGTAIMVGTGVLLTFTNWSMHYFPKWVLDVAVAIHFYEALLATLAILVWHFYFVIFDPEHYPMNWSIITGNEPGSQETPSEPKSKE